MIQAFGLTSNSRKALPPAVDDVSFEARAGRVTVLLGAPGAGKTTTLRLLLELQQGRGLAYFRGRPLHRIAHPSREVGVLLGDVPGHPARSVRGHVRMLCAAAGVPARRADEVLEVVGLVSLRDERLGTLSRGMDRRLGLACALLADPHTLVLDNPADGLSGRESRWLYGMLRAHADQGGTVLTTTTDPKEAARTADRVLTLDRGALVADQEATDFARTRLRPRVAVRSPHAVRLAALLAKEARTAQRSVEVVQEDGNRLSVYGSSCAQVGETAFRHDILIHQLADETGDMGPGAGAEDQRRAHPETDPTSSAKAGPAPWGEGSAAVAGPGRGAEGAKVPDDAGPASEPRTAGATEAPCGLDDAPSPSPMPYRPADAAPRDGILASEADSPAGGVPPATACRTPETLDVTASSTALDRNPGSGPTAIADAIADALRQPGEAGTSDGVTSRVDSVDGATSGAHSADGTTSGARSAASGAPAAPAVSGGGRRPTRRFASRDVHTLPDLPPPISVRSAPGPLRPLRYELRRATGVGTGFTTGAAVLIVSALTALLLARAGHTAQARLLAAWPTELPLPPAALGAGLLGALAFGDEFRHPALAADRGTVPRRLGVLTAKLLVAALTALMLAFLTVGCDAEALYLVYGREVAQVPADWLSMSASWFGLVVGCAWTGVLAAGVFRSTTAGLAAVVAMPVVVLPLVQKAVESASVRTAAGFSVRLRELLLVQWPFGGDRYVAAAARVIAQPVGGAMTLSLTALLCAYLLTTLRSKAR
ncbi:ABC-type multidrug transport system ATPase subunit [Streptomyces sp. 3330]|uniref:ATP-binding cassette domain-containing protein n=1 Tax=Streptomyces sp. 3330 TaxID=2817755 RepID=UPI0028631CCC|nr:ATP-binding cassette domain-containing protein [Streptomyces sp. 3330]MDR6979262.1 ABC-type multidrug transport system ATPase subunit [Streptomyces sp. 3330]